MKNMVKEIKLMLFSCFGLNAPEVSGSFEHRLIDKFLDADGIMHNIIVGKEYVVNDFYEEDVLDISIKLHDKRFVALKLEELCCELRFFEKLGFYPFKMCALFQCNNDGVFYVKDASFFKILYCKGVSDHERHRLRCNKKDCTILSCGCSSTQKVYHNLFPAVRLGRNPYCQVFLPGFEIMLRAFGIRDYFDFLFGGAFNALLEIEFIENTDQLG